MSHVDLRATRRWEPLCALNVSAVRRAIPAPLIVWFCLLCLPSALPALLTHTSNSLLTLQPVSLCAFHPVHTELILQQVGLSCAFGQQR